MKIQKLELSLLPKVIHLLKNVDFYDKRQNIDYSIALI